MDDNRIPAFMSRLPVNSEIKKLRDDRKRINNKNNSKDLLLNAVTDMKETSTPFGNKQWVAEISYPF